MDNYQARLTAFLETRQNKINRASWQLHYQDAPKRFVVSLSSGTSSAVAAELAILEYGRANVDLVFMDVLNEDQDNYRFLWQLLERWGGSLFILQDGRRPIQVFDDKALIPNSLHAPCTSELKIKLFVEYCQNLQKQGFKPVAIIGYNKRDKLKGRLQSPIDNYGKIGIDVEYPLLWGNGIDSPKDVVKSWGIAVPRMYDLGYDSANCGGQCIKGGQKYWRRTLFVFPDRFMEFEVWEREKRKDKRFSRYTILKRTIDGKVKNLTLEQLRLETEQALAGLNETERIQQMRRWELEDDLQSTCTANECGIGDIHLLSS